MIRLRLTLDALFKRRDLPTCDTCAFADYFRSNGDRQAARLQGFCRCLEGPFKDRPIPRERRCEVWQRAERPAKKPQVGDPNLTV